MSDLRQGAALPPTAPHVRVRSSECYEAGSIRNCRHGDHSRQYDKPLEHIAQKTSVRAHVGAPQDSSDFVASSLKGELWWTMGCYKQAIRHMIDDGA
jgi:hypothetical protein